MTLTPIFALGWETNSLLEANAASDSTMPTVSSTKARTGTYSLRNQFASNLAAVGRVVDSLTELQAAMAVNHNGFNSTANSMFRLVAADSTAFVVRTSGSGATLQLRMGSTTLDEVAMASTGMSAVDTWHDCSVALKIANPDGYFSFYGPNGTRLLHYGGSTGSSPIVAVMFGGGGWNQYAYLDDCRCLDATGEGSRAASTRRFLWATANGNGQVSDWTNSSGNSTNNYSYVDDTSADSDTTYVKALSAGLEDQYTHGGVTVPADWVPVRVWPTAIGLKTDAGVDTTVKLGLWKASSEADSAEQTLATSYGPVQAYFESLPDASSLTESNINATEIRLVSAGDYS